MHGFNAKNDLRFPRAEPPAEFDLSPIQACLCLSPFSFENHQTIVEHERLA